jgi:spermidine/putrescine transport system permease protein
MTRLRTIFMAPAAVVLTLFFLVPLCIVVAYSLLSRGAYGGVINVLTFENWLRLFDPLYGIILLRTIVMALSVTVACLVLGFPLALFISRAGKRKHLYLQLVILPFWTSFLVRTYAWMFLLRDTGLINTMLQTMGVTREPLPLLYNDGAVFIGLVYGHLPFVVLPLYATLERLDKALLEAAADLGSRPWQTMLHVVLPLTAPGFRAAAVLAFIPSLGAYLTPDLLGGGKTVMAGNLIQNQFTTARDWPFGSAVALLVMAIIAGLLMLWMRRDREGLA